MRMLLAFILTGLGGLLLLLVCEYIISTFHLRGENARKLVHISIAIYASMWAFYLSSTVIALISIILISAVIAVQKYHLLHSFESVKRVTFGEIWYPLGIGIAAILFDNPYIYALAVLHMGLADGLAAVVGVGMGKNAKRFKVGKNTKSVAGTIVFVATSFLLFSTYWLLFASVPLFADSLPSALLISFSSAIIVATIEVISPKGSDNILVPITAGVLAVLPTIQLIV
jgi:dolichol kinase